MGTGIRKQKSAYGVTPDAFPAISGSSVRQAKLAMDSGCKSRTKSELTTRISLELSACTGNFASEVLVRA